MKQEGLRWWLGRLVLLTIAVSVAAWPAGATVGERVLRNQPFYPFRVIGNIHYVGPAGTSSFLITTDEGAFLLDGGMRESAPIIMANIETLGFALEDVKYLLNSHVHYDHAGGLEAIRRQSGATVVASEGDTPWLRLGGPDVPSVTVGRVIPDGGELRLGGTTMVARITPGHTPGCTTWTTTVVEAGSPYRVVFACSTSMSQPLVNNRQYPTIVGDFERSFATLRSMTSDVFLGSHPEFFDMGAKRRRLGKSATNPFIDPAELRIHVEQSEREFRATLAWEQAQVVGR